MNGDVGDDEALPLPLTVSDAADGCVEVRFEDWYRDHYERLRALCARILSDAGSAEDIAQETLLRAWLGRDRMREQDVGAWLSVVARNLCVSHMRRRWRAVPHEVMPEMLDESADPALAVELAETRRSVRRALAQVGDRHRRLLVRREVVGADYAELGDELGLTASGARAVLFRARRSLKERLAAVGEGCSGILLGTKIKIRTTMERLRAGVLSAEAGAPGLVQAGVNAAIVASLALGVGLSADTLARRPIAVAIVSADSTLVAPRSTGGQESQEMATSNHQKPDRGSERGRLSSGVADVEPGRPRLNRHERTFVWDISISDRNGNEVFGWGVESYDETPEESTTWPLVNAASDAVCSTPVCIDRVAEGQA